MLSYASGLLSYISALRVHAQVVLTCCATAEIEEECEGPAKSGEVGNIDMSAAKVTTDEIKTDGIVNLSPSAIAQVTQLRKSRGGEELVMRVGVRSGGCRYVMADRRICMAMLAAFCMGALGLVCIYARFFLALKERCHSLTQSLKNAGRTNTQGGHIIMMCVCGCSRVFHVLCASSGMSYVMEFEDASKVDANDSEIKFDGFKVVVDPKSLMFVYGMTLDFRYCRHARACTLRTRT